MTLRDWAARTSPRYGEIRAPVVIVAGTDDKAVDYRGHSVRLHRDIPGSRLHIWPNTGHMVHHSRCRLIRLRAAIRSMSFYSCSTIGMLSDFISVLGGGESPHDR